MQELQVTPKDEKSKIENPIRTVEQYKASAAAWEAAMAYSTSTGDEDVEGIARANEVCLAEEARWAECEHLFLFGQHGELVGLKEDSEAPAMDSELRVVLRDRYDHHVANANGASIFGIRLEEMSRQDLLASFSFLQERHEKELRNTRRSGHAEGLLKRIFG